jgi:hypothetical protein
MNTQRRRCITALGFAAVAPLLAAAATPSRAAAGTRVALVIGNADYKIGALKNPVNDAKAVATSLRGLGFDVTHRENASLREMLEAFQQFSTQSKAADVRVVYYAGHGVQLKGRNYLLPVDTEIRAEDEVPAKSADLTELLERLGALPQGINIVILDACRNNPFAVSGAKRSVVRGLGRVEPEGNTLVAYAAKDGTTTDDGKGPHSPFTAALLKRIATPGLDVRRVFGYVSEDVKAATNRLQEPYLYGQLGGEEIHLVKAAPLVLPPPPSAPPVVVAPPPVVVAPPPPQPGTGADAVRVCREVETCGSGSRTPGIRAIWAPLRRMAPCGKAATRLCALCAGAPGDSAVATSVRPTAPRAHGTSAIPKSVSGLPGRCDVVWQRLVAIVHGRRLRSRTTALDR